MPVRFGPFLFDDDAHELLRDGVRVHLSPKAFRLLELLIGARPNPVSRETLYAALWPDVVVEPGNLHGLVAEIRSATREAAIVRTVHRVGYAFGETGLDLGAARFAILFGDEEIPLRSGENVIGRDPREAVVVQAAGVSRRHARLFVNGSEVTLEDLGSKNGTFVGRERVSGVMRIEPGCEITVGTVRLRVVRVDALAPTATID